MPVLPVLVRASVAAAALLAAACAATPGDFSPRLSERRLAVVDESNLTEAQRDMLASRSSLNIYRTLAHHVDLYNRWSPLGQVLLNNQSISPRHRELAMLRMGWLCQSPYEWSQHARIAKASAGMTDAEIRAIAAAPDGPGWSDIDRAVMKMADELRYDAIISDATWAELRKVYSDTQVMELLYTAAQYQLVSMALNTLGIQIEPEAVDHMPNDLPSPPVATRPVGAPRLASPRIAPRRLDQLDAEQRALINSRVDPDGSVMNLYSTLITNPRLYGPRLRFGSYLQRDGLLDSETRELLILRTAWNIRADYEWAHHEAPARATGLTDAHLAAVTRGPSDPVWTPRQRAVLSAADELRREAFISDATWSQLAAFFSMKERIEIVFTVGGYTMTGLAINSFGIQTEPGYPAMPN
jgi:4-carboxymuconolactone decarboxylase